MRRGCVWPIRPRSPRPDREADLGQLRRLARARLAADDDHLMLADRRARSRRRAARPAAPADRRSAGLARGARPPALAPNASTAAAIRSHSRRRRVRAARAVDAPRERDGVRGHGQRQAGRRGGRREKAWSWAAGVHPKAVLRPMRRIRSSGADSTSPRRRALSSPPPAQGRPCACAPAGHVPRGDPMIRNLAAAALAVALASALALRRAAGRRRDPALGRPRRHADDRPAFAEREPDQQHQPARLRIPARQRDKKLGLVPALAESWTQVNPDDVALQAAPRRQVPRRHAVHRRRRRVQLRARARRHVAAARLRQRVGHPEEDRRPDRRVHDQRPQPDRARAHRDDQHHEQGLVREEPRDEAAELHAEGGHDHRAPGERHRARTC